MNCDVYKYEFEWDGSWRDLYVLKTDISHWQQLINLIHEAPYKMTFKEDNEIAPMPYDAAQIFRQRKETPVLLSIDLGGILVTCHFFTEQEIEFDIDPREISGEEKLRQVFEFIR